MTTNDRVERGMSLDVVRDGVPEFATRISWKRGVQEADRIDGEMEGHVQLGNMEGCGHLLTVGAPLEPTR